MAVLGRGIPATTGASHGFAAFTTLLIGTMLSKFVWGVVYHVGRH
jgi:hypothetical protein